MKTLTLALLTALPLVLACGDKDGDTGATGDSGVADADLVLAQDLWTEISGYSSWPASAGWEDLEETPGGVHGESVQIWVNTAAYDVISAGASADMPAGAISVKEGYSDAAGTTLSGIVAMKKIDGYDSANGDWFWAKYSADGTPELYGSVSGCYDCHSDGQDYVLHTTW